MAAPIDVPAAEAMTADANRGEVTVHPMSGAWLVYLRGRWWEVDMAEWNRVGQLESAGMPLDGESVRLTPHAGPKS